MNSISNTISNTIRNLSKLVIVGILLASQAVFAQTASDTPQWVLDRQQYDTSFVYVQLDEPASSEQWVLDRQQYETTFVQLEESSSMAQAIPQWALDRQQYETTYVFSPHDSDPIIPSVVQAGGKS